MKIIQSSGFSSSLLLGALFLALGACGPEPVAKPAPVIPSGNWVPDSPDSDTTPSTGGDTNPQNPGGTPGFDDNNGNSGNSGNNGNGYQRSTANSNSATISHSAATSTGAAEGVYIAVTT